MPGNLTQAQLKKAVASGEIDTVIAAQVDMQGRLMGKRFQAEHFLSSAIKETHSCNYLLATDMEMHTVEGYAASSWAAGYGDYTMIPDLSTLRRLPWLEGTAMVLCDVVDHHSHAEVPHSPRAILKRQIARLEERGMTAQVATELEFFLFRQSYEEIEASGYRGIDPISPYNEDYHIFQTTKEEDVVRAIRNGLHGAGIPVENTKGEAERGQEEINITHAEPLECADNHAITKTGCKEIAWSRNRALTFMAKWDTDMAGSSSHIHQSLWSRDGKTPLFHDPKGEYGMSETMASLSQRSPGACQRDHLFPRALHQLLQTFREGHLRADQGGLGARQPHGGVPGVRRRHQVRTHRMPRRRRRPQSLSRALCVAGGGARRHRAQDGT